MKETRVLMGMPVTIEIVDPSAPPGVLNVVFAYFKYVDEKFSTYKEESEIMRINRGELHEGEWSEDMKMIFALAEKTKGATDGFFDIKTPNGSYDPSGIVKGWAIQNAAKLLAENGIKNFYVDAGGDVRTSGRNAQGGRWSIGIKNPWNVEEIVKTIYASGEGVATSGTYIRGLHIYNPKTGEPADEISSMTIVGPTIYEADLYATPAFVMGHAGIQFIESVPGLEGYMIDKEGIATMTSNFLTFTNAER